MPAWRMRRSVMITPGHRPERLAKAVSLPADSLIFDLEDAVPPARKPEARAVVARALTELSFGHRERAVRLNGIGSADFAADMAALPHTQCGRSGEGTTLYRRLSGSRRQGRKPC